jgi:DNA-binding response OmpR family regulator
MPELLYADNMTRLLVIDDDVTLLGLLQEYLVEEHYVVDVECDATRGVSEALSGDYALVVLDVMMPVMDGLDVLWRIRQDSTLPVIMLTARGDDFDRIAGLELGADDYVAKPCTPRELVARIRAILRRTQVSVGTDASAPLLAAGALTMWPEQRRAEWRGARVQFTSTEFRLLEVLLLHAGAPVSKNDLSLRALGRPHARYDRCIDVHVSSIRRKLGTLADGRPPILAVHRQGYQLLKE